MIPALERKESALVNYYIRHGNVLSEQQKQEIAGLIQACEAWEPVRLVPLMEAEENIDPELPCFYLAYREGSHTLIGFLSLFLPDGETAEATVFIRPDCRRRGVMTALLQKAGEMLEEESLSFFLLSDGNGRDGEAAAAHWKLKPDHLEKLMEIRADDLAGHQTHQTGGSEREVYLRRRGQCWYLYRKDHKRYIGKCFLVPLAEGITYLYGLEIRPEWRNQGYGRLFLQEIGKRSCGILRLQVTSENPAACHLYEACGFRTLEQVVYYPAPV